MDIKKYLKAMPVVAALLLAASCSNEDDEIIEAPQPAQRVRIIHYEATVSNDSQTRATLNGDGNYVFETGDKLYVWGNNISGELTLTSGVGGNSDATFSGDLTYTPGDGDPDTPEDDLALQAVIVSPSDKIFGTLAEFKARNFEPSYTLSASTPYASSRAEAVQRFSYFKSYSNYGAKSFDFSNSQLSTFLSFDITLEDGTAAGTTIPVTISNNGSEISKGSVTTVKEGEAIKAKFVAGILGSIQANNAKVTLDNRDAISFGGTNWLYFNNIYNVTRTYTKYMITASGNLNVTSPTSMVVPITKEKKNLDLPYNTTLGEILGDKIDALTAFSKESGSITFGQFDASDWGSTTVSIAENGATAVIKVSGQVTTEYMGTNAIFTFENSEITLKVSKMTPPTE